MFYDLVFDAKIFQQLYDTAQQNIQTFLVSQNNLKNIDLLEMIDDFYAYVKTVLVRHKGTADLNVEDADQDAQNDQDFMAEEIENGEDAGGAGK